MVTKSMLLICVLVWNVGCVPCLTVRHYPIHPPSRVHPCRPLGAQTPTLAHFSPPPIGAEVSAGRTVDVKQRGVAGGLPVDILVGANVQNKDCHTLRFTCVGVGWGVGVGVGGRGECCRALVWNGGVGDGVCVLCVHGMSGCRVDISGSPSAPDIVCACVYACGAWWYANDGTVLRERAILDTHDDGC